MFDHFEKFLIDYYIGYLFQDTKFYVYNSLRKMVIFIFLFLCVCWFIFENILIYNNFEKVLEILFNFVWDSIKDSMFIEKYLLIVLLYTLLLILLFCNYVVPADPSITISLIDSWFFNMASVQVIKWIIDYHSNF